MPDDPSGQPQGDPPNNSNSPSDPPADPPKTDPPKTEPTPQGDDTDWKAEAKKWEKRAKTDGRELEKLREASKTEDEKALDAARKQAADEARTAALAEVRGERLSTLVQARATGKLADPGDAERFLDLDDFDPSKPADVDKAIDELVKSKPYLAASSNGSRDNDINQGPRGGGSPQLTRENLKTMSPEQIETARQKGQLDALMKGG